MLCISVSFSVSRSLALGLFQKLSTFTEKLNFSESFSESFSKSKNQSKRSHDEPPTLRPTIDRYHNGYSTRPSPGRCVPGDRRSLDGVASQPVSDSQASAVHGSDAMRQSRPRGVDAVTSRRAEHPAPADARHLSRLSGDSASRRSGAPELDAHAPEEPAEIPPRQLFQDGYELPGELSGAVSGDRLGPAGYADSLTVPLGSPVRDDADIASREGLGGRGARELQPITLQ